MSQQCDYCIENKYAQNKYDVGQEEELVESFTNWRNRNERDNSLQNSCYKTVYSPWLRNGTFRASAIRQNHIGWQVNGAIYLMLTLQR